MLLFCNYYIMDSLSLLVASHDNIVLAGSGDINLSHCNWCPVIIYINLVRGQLCFAISRQEGLVICKIFSDYTKFI